MLKAILRVLKFIGLGIIFLEVGIIFFSFATPQTAEKITREAMRNVSDISDATLEAKISQPAQITEFEKTKEYGKIDCNYPESNAIAGQILHMVNTDRKEQGKKELVWNSKLCLSAQLKSQDMAEYHYFEHVSPTLVTPWHWMDVAGYPYKFSGENLALNYYTAQEAHTALMNSPGHRSNILSEDFREIGIAYFWGEVDNQDAFFIVEHFGTLLETRKTTVRCDENTAKDNIKELKKTTKQSRRLSEKSTNTKRKLPRKRICYSRNRRIHPRP